MKAPDGCWQLKVGNEHIVTGHTCLRAHEHKRTLTHMHPLILVNELNLPCCHYVHTGYVLFPGCDFLLTSFDSSLEKIGKTNLKFK